MSAAAATLGAACAIVFAGLSGFIGGRLGIDVLEPSAALPVPAPAAPAAEPQHCECLCTWRLELPSLHLPLELLWATLGALLAVTVFLAWRRCGPSPASPLRRPAVLALR